VGIDVWVLEMLLTTFLDIQKSIFMLAMKSNALDTVAKLANLNPFTQLLCTLLTSKMIFFFFFRIQIGKDCHGTSSWKRGKQAN
jgi:hypothetical protein